MAERLTLPGTRRITTPGEVVFIPPGADSYFVLGKSHRVEVARDPAGTVRVRLPEIDLPRFDAGTGREVDRMGIVLPPGFFLSLHRSIARGITIMKVNTDTDQKVVAVDLPDYSDSPGGRMDFTDVAEGRGNHARLWLTDQGTVALENMDTREGIAIPAAVVASGKEAAPAAERQETIRPSFEVGMATDRGRNPTRELNEDAVFAVREAMFGFGGFAGESGLVGVCDGMGGHAAGEVASRLAAAAIIDRYRAGAKAGQSTADLAKEALRAANARIIDEKKKGTVAAGAGTTGVIGLQVGDKITIAHVGDSRAYRIGADGKIRQLTTDHSLVQRLVEVGQLKPEEVADHPQRSVLYKTLGDNHGVEVDVTQVSLGAGDSLLLCSDGLTGMVADGDIAGIVTGSVSAQAAAERLIAAANAAGGDDNISAIVVRNVSEAVSVDEKMLVGKVINDIAAEISGGNPDRQRLQQLITELLSGAAALAADRQKLNKTMAFALKVAQKYHLDFG